MKSPTCGRTRELLAAFYDDELPCELSYSIQEHINHCDGCGAFARLEQGFTRAMRARLQHIEAPVGLFERVKEHFDDEPVGALDEDSTGSAGRKTRIGRTAYAAAAALLAGALLVPMVNHYGPVTMQEIIDSATGVRQVSGVLVCVECSRHGLSLDEQRRCRNTGHHTGVEIAGGGLWHFVARKASLPLLSDPSLRGQRVVVQGRFLDDIRYVDARSITVASQ
ncbi:MAG: hypothetical protein ACE5HU_03115 [Acidobacteriota bacterium]